MGSSHSIDISGLLGGGRGRLLVDERIPVEPFEGMRFPERARVRLELFASGGMLEIAGTVEARAIGQCGRCLDEVSTAMEVDVSERFVVGAQAQDDPLGEGNVVRDERLDLGDLANQIVCSAVPLGVLCSETCLGICPRCGENKNAGACTCEPETEIE